MDYNHIKIKDLNLKIYITYIFEHWLTTIYFYFLGDSGDSYAFHGAVIDIFFEVDLRNKNLR